MRYKVSTKTNTEIFNVETLLKYHRRNKELHNMLRQEKDEIIFTITGVPGIETHTIIFKKL